LLQKIFLPSVRQLEGSHPEKQMNQKTMKPPRNIAVREMRMKLMTSSNPSVAPEARILFQHPL
jgi:hypothetical protein